MANIPEHSGEKKPKFLARRKLGTGRSPQVINHGTKTDWLAKPDPLKMPKFPGDY